MTENQTPQDYLATHPLTARLKQLGVTEDQLAGMRFWKHSGGLPFDLWPVTWGSGTPLEAVPLIKAYRALCWLTLDDPPSSRDKDDAWQYVSMTVAAPVYAAGSRYLHAQKVRARLPRGKITENGLTLGEMISQLADQPECRELTANELWPKLWALLEAEGLDPQEKRHSSDPDKVSYDYTCNRGQKTITRARFGNILAEHRHERKSR